MANPLAHQMASEFASFALIKGALKTVEDLQLEQALGQAYRKLDRAEFDVIVRACAALATVRKIVDEVGELADYRACPECHRKIFRVNRGLGPDFYCARCIREL